MRHINAFDIQHVAGILHVEHARNYNFRVLCNISIYDIIYYNVMRLL